MSSIALTFEAFEERAPGPAWQALFERHWPRYRTWFLSEGEVARTTYVESIQALRIHMPELVETYETLCALAGGGDLEARFLAMFAPPSYLSGCSQAVWRDPGTGAPFLVRNYDYAPERLEGAIVSTAWAGKRIIGVSDCAWGLLDGLNEDGLAVSLAFGGREVVGAGFGVPLVVRYLLQTCASTEEARVVLLRLPFHLAHTLTVVDAQGDTCTAYLSPDRDLVLTEAPVATNHQGEVEWTEHARATLSLEREGALMALVSGSVGSLDDLTRGFLASPLYLDGYARSMGTLYTVAYDVRGGRATYCWPSITWEQSFADFRPGVKTIQVGSTAAA